MHKSHLSDPDRLARLMMAACSAYLWIIYPGQEAVRRGWHQIFHRKSRVTRACFRSV